MKIRLSVFVFAIVFVSGCASRPTLTRAEWLTTTTRTYEGKTAEEVIAAAEKLLILADGDDVQFAHDANGFVATRQWFSYIVIAAAAGTDNWRFDAEEAGDVVKATVQVGLQSQAITPMATSSGDWAASTGIVMGAPVQGTALYDVFWARLDFLLGKREAWMFCGEADDRVSRGVVWGSNEALCNSFNLEDDAPEGVVVEKAPSSAIPMGYMR